MDTPDPVCGCCRRPILPQERSWHDRAFERPWHLACAELASLIPPETERGNHARTLFRARTGQ